MGVSNLVLTELAAGNTALEGLAVTIGKSKRDIVKAVQVLKRHSLVETHECVRGEVSGPARGTYALTEAGRAAAESGVAISPGAGERPRKKTVGLREKAWWHFRAHKVASLKELLNTHATGTEKAASINLYKWIAALEAAGVVKRLGRRVPAKQSKGIVVWALEKDLGLQAPVWRQQAREVYDPNSGVIYPMARKGEGA